ncbi:MAG: apolipoprotein N-acyltransferase [Gemmatimonadota bacterium]|nr:apolipoprotein N-acyltransferase [Gemmatimonadota bacterium]
MGLRRPSLALWRSRVVPDGAGPVLLAGILLGLAHPPFRLLLPPFVALVPFIVWHERLADTREGARQARVGGFFLGLVYFTLVFYWLLVALIYYTSWAILAFLAPVVIMSWFLAGMSGAIHQARRRAGWPAWLAFPVFWTATEWFRAHLSDVSFPWMQLGDTLAYYPRIVGAADLVGSRGLSFWLVAAQTLIAAVWLGRSGGGALAASRVGAVAERRLILVLLLVLGLPIGYSVLRWNTIEIRPVARVGVVQPNIPQHIRMSDRAETARLSMQSIERLVAPWVGAGEDLDLVLLPESAVTGQLDPIPSLGLEAWSNQEEWADGIAAAVGADMVYGGLGVNDLAGVDYELTNSAFLTRPGVGRVARYDKRFLVPVVERVPFLNPRWFSQLDYFGGFAVGPWVVPLELDGSYGSASYGIMICYESVFSPLARHYRRNGADFVVNVTNDAWFGRDSWWSKSSALWQHPAHLVMRAVESRVGIARAANTGVSELVDPLGRVTNATTLFEPAAFTGDVMTTDSVTLYVRFGDVVGWLSALAAMVGVGVSLYRVRRGAREL